MKIRIVKRTNINGKVVNIGDVCDVSFIAPQDLRTLLNCGCAVVLKDAPKAETADAKTPTETADAAPAPKKKAKK